MHNQDSTERYKQAIRNFIIINKRKGMTNILYVDTAIEKLSEVVADKDIKAIKTDDFISLASHAILTIGSEINPESLISVINLQNAGQKLNVMAAVKLSEIIFETEPIDQKLFALAAKQINRRHLLLCYDVIEPIISDADKLRFTKLMDSIILHKK